MEAEEKTFYAEVRKAPEGKQLVAEGLKEHSEAREMIANISSAAGDAVWLQKVKSLEKAFQHHVYEEEGEMFGAARMAIDQRRASSLGAEFQARKKASK